MNSIMVLAHDDDGQAARLQAAVDLARAGGGHLACIDSIAPMASSWDACGQSPTADLLVDRCLRKTANATRLKARLTRENIAWNWIDGSGFLGDSLEIASELADLVVVSIGQGSNGLPELRKLAEHLATARRGPILAVPREVIGFDPTGTALVVLDGSCSDDALRDAVPLLEMSREVILLDVAGLTDRGTTGCCSSMLAKPYLAGRGIDAAVHCAPRRRDATFQAAIRDQAHEFDAAYIVMGATGHSPAILNDTIRSMLATSTLPLFITRR